jgi:Outer membrane protein beta-barrel domain
VYKLNYKIMKKLLSLLLISGFAFGAHAQDKKFQIGLVLGPTFNWTKIQTSEIERNGIGGGFTIGVGGNYLFNKNVGLASGIQFDLESFKINYGTQISSSTPSGRVYYGYNDTDILEYDNEASTINNLGNDTTSILELTERKFKGKYVTIPIFLKFQTDMIGNFKYYGKFGLRTSILVGSRFDDVGYNAVYTNNSFERTSSAVYALRSDMQPVTALKGLTPVRTGIGIYGGAEWNFTGSTFLYMEGGFIYGITPSMQKVSKHLINQTDDGTTNGGVYGDGNLSHSALDIKNNPQHLIEVKVGLLF